MKPLGTSSLRRFGLELVGKVPWGTHLCQFYESKEDLVKILVPYFAEGLRGNEFCMWVTSLPLEVDEAKKAGYHQMKWDGKDASGKEVSSGIYLYSIQAGEFKMTKKMVKME